MASIKETFLKQRNAQKKTAKPSEGTAKRQRVEPSQEYVPIDPTTIVATIVANDDDELL